MKLLFDENISPRLVAGLSDVFPGSVHVRDVGLARATDAAADIEALLRSNRTGILAFGAEADAAFLALS